MVTHELGHARAVSSVSGNCPDVVLTSGPGFGFSLYTDLSGMPRTTARRWAHVLLAGYDADLAAVILLALGGRATASDPWRDTLGVAFAFYSITMIAGLWPTHPRSDLRRALEILERGGNSRRIARVVVSIWRVSLILGVGWLFLLCARVLT